MEAVLGPEVITSYKRLSYTPWFALAEFVDNSTQAFKDFREELDPVYELANTTLEVCISYGKDQQGEYLTISDNCIGMSKETLEKAVIIGKSPSDGSWRSKYGLGLKTAACWFGNWWSIETKRLGDTTGNFIEFDVERVAKGDMDLRYQDFKSEPERHYTVITIRNLNRALRTKTISKTKNYLESIYRIDCTNNLLRLFWENEQLIWDYDVMIYDRLLTNHRGEVIRPKFEFLVKGKKVWGWAGVFGTGSRADAGFSVIQANRVIKGWPDAFKPNSLFGDQEGGVNNLVNQRLVGEIFLEGFEISHTKDEILFSDEESAELEDGLLSRLGDLKNLALTYRKYEADSEKVDESDDDAALAEFFEEVNSTVLRDIIRNYDTPPPDQLERVNSVLTARITQKSKPSIKVDLDGLTVYLYLEQDMSPNDPYVIIDSMNSRTSVIVIINRSHPHWDQIAGVKAAINFIRHCVYDGVAEWKCYQKIGAIQPDTVKKFKDMLLRVPFEIERSTVL